MILKWMEKNIFKYSSYRFIHLHIVNKIPIWNCRKPLTLKIYPADTLMDFCTFCSLLMTAWSIPPVWCADGFHGHLWKLSDQAPVILFAEECPHIYIADGCLTKSRGDEFVTYLNEIYSYFATKNSNNFAFLTVQKDD